MRNIDYRKDIDVLRAVAVLLVVIFHAFPSFLPGGYVGVDVFFVISGYLITSIMLTSIREGEFSLLAFYKKRIRRLFPALIFVLVVSVCFGWIVLFPDELKMFGKHLYKSVMFILNYEFIDELGYFDVESHYKPLLHLWSLSVEEQYYLFWPLLLLGAIYTGKPVFFLVGVIILSFTLNVYYVEDYRDEVFFNTFMRIWQLGIGSLLAIVLSDKILASRNLLFILGTFLIFLSAVFYDEKTLYPGYHALLPTMGAACVIVANSNYRFWTGLITIGLISYPLYLWHWPILSFMRIYFGIELSEFIVFSGVVLSFLAAYFTFKYVEMIRYIGSNFVVVSLIVVMFFIGVSGFVLNKNNGLPNRDHLSYLKKYGAQFLREPATNKQCLDFFSDNNSEARDFYYCRMKYQGENKIIAVIGDSHADVMFSGIANQATNYGYGTIMLANSSCPTFLGFEWYTLPDKVNKCQNSIKQILELIKQDERIDRIFIATRGPIYIHGEVEGSFSEDSVAKSLSTFTSEEKRNYEQLSKGFSNTLNILSANKHISKVFYFIENPELDFLPKEKLPRLFDSRENLMKSATVDQKLYNMRMARYKDVVFDMKKKFSKLHVIDPSPYLCEKGRCFSYKNGNFLYADDDHFSLHGSQYIAEKIENILFAN